MLLVDEPVEFLTFLGAILYAFTAGTFLRGVVVAASLAVAVPEAFLSVKCLKQNAEIRPSTSLKVTNPIFESK